MYSSILSRATEVTRFFLFELEIMTKNTEIVSGSVVFCRWQPMVVLHVMEEEALLCPLVSENEPLHRGDMELAWHDLAEAGLSRLDVRFRGVVCRRNIRGLKLLGSVSATLLRRMHALACREQEQRLLEQCAERRSMRSTFPDDRPFGGVKQVWMHRGGHRMEHRGMAG